MSDTALPQPRRKGKAGLSPKAFEDLGLDIQSSMSRLCQRYSELHELVNTQGVSGMSERVSGGGTPDTTGGLVANNDRALHDLAACTESARNAWNSITAGHGKLTSIEQQADKSHDLVAEPIERMREFTATRGALVQVLIRNRANKIEEFATEIKKLDDRIRPLFHHIDVDDAEEVIRTMESRARNARSDGEKEALRLEREVKHLQAILAKARNKANAKNATKQQSQWQRGA